MEQIARSGMLVANHRDRGLQIADAIQTESAKNAADGSPAQIGGLGNGEAGEPLAAQLFDALHQVLRGTPWGAMRTRGTILQPSQPLLLQTAGPTRRGARADKARGRPHGSPAQVEKD